MNEYLSNGRYKIIKKIGNGKMGSVYLAYCSVLNRKVAIKHVERSANSNSEEFSAEAKAIARISHHGIVQVFDFFEEESKSFIVMEYIEGQSLKDILSSSNGKLSSIKAAVKLVMRLALALESAHTRGVIHKDIKPDNILIDDNKQPRITDFGIATIIESNTFEKSEKMAGTLRYCSPEQLKGKIVDNRTDIYSLGIVMFELITGSSPFADEKPMDAALKRLKGELPLLSEFREGIDSDLEKIFLKATSLDKDDRYPEMIDFYKDLNQYLISVIKNKENTLFEKRKNKILYSLYGAVAGFLLIILLSLPFMLKDRTPIRQVPNVLGMYYQDAGHLLSKNELYSVVNESEFSDVVSKGSVISQSVAEGENVEVGSKIYLKVSKGREKFDMPSFYNLTKEEAIELAKKLNIGLKFDSGEYSDKVEKDRVLYQSVTPGSSVYRKSELGITLSLGEEEKKIVVPNVENADLSIAIETITDLGLKVKFTQEFSDSHSFNSVISQSVTPGEKIKQDSVIELVVSKGPSSSQSNSSNLIDYKFVIDTSTFENLLNEFTLRIVVVNGDEKTQIYSGKHLLEEGRIFVVKSLEKNSYYEIYADDYKVGEGIVE